MISVKEESELQSGIGSSCKRLFLTSAIPEMSQNEGTPKQLEYLRDALAREIKRREENHKERLIKRARFPVYKTFEGYGFDQIQLPPALNRTELEDVSFIKKKQNLVL